MHSDDGDFVSIVAAPHLLVELWKLQSANRSEGGEVREEDDLASLLR